MRRNRSSFVIGQALITSCFVSHPRCAVATPNRIIVEVPHGMRVGVDREPHPVAPSPQHVLVTQIEPVGIGVDLERRAGAAGRLEHRLEIEVDRDRARRSCGS